MFSFCIDIDRKTFHGDNGAGLGASHQTGWTGVVARLIEVLGETDRAVLLASGVRAGMRAHAPKEKGTP